MRKQLNVKFLGILVGTAGVLTLSVHLVHGYQVRRNSGNLLGQADRAEEQGRLDQAAEYLSRYLGFVPKDTDALAKYGLMLAHEKLATSARARLRAFVALQQVVVREPERHAVRRRLVRVAMNLGRFTDAREHLETLLKSSAQDAELEQLLGECEEANGQYAKAGEWFAKAGEHAPARIDSYVRRARLLRRRLDEPKRADAVMDTLIERNPQSAAARLARARYFQELGSLEKGANDVARALALAPQDAEVLLVAAELAEAQGQPEQARKTLRHGLLLHPEERRIYHALAWLELRSGRRPEALTCLRQSLQLPCDDAMVLWNTANLLIEAGELEQAREQINRLRKNGSLASTLGYLHARLLLSERKWFQASRAFEQIRPRLVQMPELTLQTDLYLGQCYQQLGNADLQLGAYRRAVSLEPLQVPARLGLGAALLSVGRLDEALDEYRLLINRAPAARIAVARLLLVRNLRLPPGQRRWDELEQILNLATRVGVPSVEVPILRAELLAARGQPADAQKFLEAARDQQPEQPELWVALATLATRRGEAQQALRLLQDAKEHLGECGELRVALARYWARRRGPEARPALAALERDLDKGTGEDQITLLRELADALYLLGDVQGAERLWRELARRQPDQLYVRLLLFDLALHSANEDGLGRILEEIRSIEGEGSLWHYGEAARLALRTRLGNQGECFDEARAHLAVSAAQRPAWSRVPVLAATLEELDGNLERAVECYQRAIELGNRQPGIIRRIVQLLYERRRFAEAEQVIRKLLEHDEAPISADLGRLAAEVALRNQQRERALELAGQAVSSASRDYRDHVWLGQILWALGQPVKAEEALRHAIRLAERVPDPWVALIQYLARTEQTEKAEATIQEARPKLAGDQARLALAQCYEAVGRKDQAEAEYLAALAERPEDLRTLRASADFYLRTGQPEKGEQPLRQLLEPRLQAPAGEMAWARRNLAVVLALRGDFGQLVDALTLLEQNRGARREADSDRRARALVIALYPNRRREAIRLFEELLRRQLPTPQEQFLLARLYEADRDWPKAREQMLSLLTSPEGANALYVAQYVRSLLRRSEVEEARGWLARLEKLEPETWRTVELKAHVLKAQALPEAAVALLQGHAGRPGASIGRVAALLDQLGQTAAAERMYRLDAAQSKDPRSALALAEHLGRQNRVEEALDVCERAWQSCPHGAVAASSMGVLRAGKPDLQQCRRVEQRLSTALATNPKTVSLLIPWAEFQDFQGQYEEAKRIYDSVLEQDPRQVVALNNLAWLLALKFDNADKGLELMNRAIAIAGPLPDLLDTRASVYLAAGQTNLALQDLEQVVMDAPAPATYFHLAQAYRRAKNRGAATQALHKAQTAGLTASGLHPLERAAWEQLLIDLARR